MIFVGLKKAFDTVDHKTFIRELEHYGVKSIEKDWFCSYLTNRKQLYRLIAITLQFRQIWQEFLTVPQLRFTCSNSTIETLEKGQNVVMTSMTLFGVFIVNFEHISHLFLVFLLLTLRKLMLAGTSSWSSPFPYLHQWPFQLHKIFQNLSFWRWRKHLSLW